MESMFWAQNGNHTEIRLREHTKRELSQREIADLVCEYLNGERIDKFRYKCGYYPEKRKTKKGFTYTIWVHLIDRTLN